jgi:hypothetical protein
MRNTEIIVFYESDKRNWNGSRMIQIMKYTYDFYMKCHKRTIKTVENMNIAEQYCLSHGWGNRGYKKNTITGNVELLNK